MRWGLGAFDGKDRVPARLLPVCASWSLQLFGYSLAAVYIWHFFLFYNKGIWQIESYDWNDFMKFWIAATQALHGNVSSGYPPIFFLIVVPFVIMPYPLAYITFQALTLLGSIVIAYLIVRRPAAIALALASPFNVHEVTWGQTGFLRASLVGAALLTLERRPVLAGVFIGCLAYKPQFGIMFPLALVAARQWRAFASAAITAGVLVVVSLTAFGIGPWEAFPHAFLAQADQTLLRGFDESPPVPWTGIQSVYGLVRALDGGATSGWIAQGCITTGIALAVWLVWRSSTRYTLKAALLSAATLVATPYVWTHDLVVIVITIAFLATDQIRCGLLRGEQTALIVLFGMAFVVGVVFQGMVPLGPVIMITLVGVILRRVLRDERVLGSVVAT
jgi:arabinofuranan 3-O-arabinosyltransferase